MVLKPIEEIGTYGGQMAWVNPGPDLGSYEFQFLYEAPYRWSADATVVEPNLVVSHEYAPDGMSMTFKLREGVKWSDGEEFTAEDLDFWWNDLVMVKEAGYTQPYWTITKETADEAGGGGQVHRQGVLQRAALAVPPADGHHGRLHAHVCAEALPEAVPSEVQHQCQGLR